MEPKLSPRLFAFVAPLLLSTALIGCDVKAAEKTGEDTSAKSSDKADAKDKPTDKGAAIKTVKLGGLGIQMDVETPEDPMVMDSKELGTMVSSGAATVTVSESKKTDPQTVEQEKSASELFNPKNFKSEKIADGWYVTFDNTGSAGANYFLTMHRKIGDKSYRCTTMLGDEKARAAAIKMCQGLKP